MPDLLAMLARSRNCFNDKVHRSELSALEAMLISYAQNFEDVMLWRALGHVEDGLYIDIGAQDPTVDSISLLFHQKRWRGIHVEPTAFYSDLLASARPGDTVIRAAVGERVGVLPLYEIPNTGISTLDAEIAEQHRERGFEVQEKSTPVVTLSAVLDLCKDIPVHWMKVDVEGFERQVLAGWGRNSSRPWVVVLESTLPLSQTLSHDRWERLILSRDYEFVYFDGLNRFYVHKSQSALRKAFSSPPNVFDGFALSGTASMVWHQHLAAAAKTQLGAVEHAAAQREDELLEQLQASQTALQEQTQNRAQREQEITAYVEAQRLQAAAERQGLEAAHRDQLEALRQAQARRQDELLQQLQTSQGALQEQTQARAQREQEIAACVEAQRVEAAGERQALEAAHREQLEALRQEQAQRQDELLRQLQTSQGALQEQTQARAQREQEITAYVEAQRVEAAGERQALKAEHREQLDALRREQAQRESEVASLQLELQYASLPFWRRWMTKPPPNDKANRRRIPAKHNLINPAVQLGHVSAARDSGVPQASIISNVGSEFVVAETNHNKSLDHLNKVFALSDADFIVAAYFTVLGRDPDADGLNSHLLKLRQTFDKEGILYDMAMSEEGRRFKSDLPGLKELVDSRNPHVSLLRRLLNKFWRLELAAQRHHALMNALLVEMKLREDKSEQILGEISFKVEALAHRFQALKSSVHADTSKPDQEATVDAHSVTQGGTRPTVGRQAGIWTKRLGAQ